MEKEEINLNNLFNSINSLKKLYDIIRIIDPIKKKVLDFSEDKIKTTDSRCYEFWKQNKVCQNCISVRAYNEDSRFVKIEYNGDRVYMITALPIKVEDGKVIVELLNDITNSGIVFDIEGKDPSEIYNILNKKNELLIKDELTGIYNRRYINERLPFEIIDSCINEEYLSMVICDIDKFKNINDKYGHIFGDYVIKKFSQKIQKHLRKDTDWIARYGGDEFLICLKNVDKKEAFSIVERIRKKIDNMHINYKGTSLKITASFGISTIYKQDISVEELIEFADKNLYKAKNEGRNKTVGDVY